MNRLSTWLLVGFATLCCGLGYWVLPVVMVQKNARMKAPRPGNGQPAQVSRPNLPFVMDGATVSETSIHLPVLSVGAWRLLVAEGEEVRAGDTLALQTFSLPTGFEGDFQALLDDTTGFDHAARLKSILAKQDANLPASLLTTIQELSQELKRVERKANRPRRGRKPHTAVSEMPSLEQREQIEAEILGAQHAITDARTELAVLDPPRNAREIADIDYLQKHISERERFIRNARQRLAGTASSSLHVPYSVAEAQAAPRLSAEQQERLSTALRALPTAARYVLAPVDGVFRRATEQDSAAIIVSGGQERRVIPPAPIADSLLPYTDLNGEVQFGEPYYLRATGLPVLWARAVRVGLGDSDRVGTQPLLKVTPRVSRR